MIWMNQRMTHRMRMTGAIVEQGNGKEAKLVVDEVVAVHQNDWLLVAVVVQTMFPKFPHTTKSQSPSFVHVIHNFLHTRVKNFLDCGVKYKSRPGLTYHKLHVHMDNGNDSPKSPSMQSL